MVMEALRNAGREFIAGAKSVMAQEDHTAEQVKKLREKLSSDLTDRLLKSEPLNWSEMPDGIHGVSIMDVGLIGGTVRYKHRVATVINGNRGVIVAINRSAQGHKTSMDLIGNCASRVGYLIYDKKLGKWVKDNKNESANHPILIPPVTGVLHFSTTETSIAPCRTHLDLQINANGIRILEIPIVQNVLNITKTAPGKPDDFQRRVDFVFGSSKS